MVISSNQFCEIQICKFAYLNLLNTHSGNEEVILPRLLQNSHYFENGLVLC